MGHTPARGPGGEMRFQFLCSQNKTPQVDQSSTSSEDTGALSDCHRHRPHNNRLQNEPTADNRRQVFDGYADNFLKIKRQMRLSHATSRISAAGGRAPQAHWWYPQCYLLWFTVTFLPPLHQKNYYLYLPEYNTLSSRRLACRHVCLSSVHGPGKAHVAPMAELLMYSGCYVIMLLCRLPCHHASTIPL